MQVTFCRQHGLAIWTRQRSLWLPWLQCVVSHHFCFRSLSHGCPCPVTTGTLFAWPLLYTKKKRRRRRPMLFLSARCVQTLQVDVVLRGRQTNDEQTFVKFDKALATGGISGGVATGGSRFASFCLFAVGSSTRRNLNLVSPRVEKGHVF